MIIDVNSLCSLKNYSKYKGTRNKEVMIKIDKHIITSIYIDSIRFLYLDEKTRNHHFKKVAASKKEKEFPPLPPYYIDTDILVSVTTFSKMKGVASPIISYWIKKNLVNSITTPLINNYLIILDDKAINIEVNENKVRKLRRNFRQRY